MEVDWRIDIGVGVRVSQTGLDILWYVWLCQYPSQDCDCQRYRAQEHECGVAPLLRLGLTEFSTLFLDLMQPDCYGIYL
jgi:hypothetical protein